MIRSAAPPDLSSFGQDMNAVVVGASGGIGGAFAALLDKHPRVARLVSASRNPSIGRRTDGSVPHRLDLEDEQSIRDLAETCAADMPGGLDLVLVATGVLHDAAMSLAPEKSHRAIDAVSLNRAFAVNTIGPALVAKHLLPLLRRDRKTAFAALSARVGSISDNRLGGWYGYRASKAALNMTIRNLAIELSRRNPLALCVGLHPGTVDTGLSRPFQSGVPEGKLFSPAGSAASLLAALQHHDAASTGQLIAWDGSIVPP